MKRIGSSASALLVVGALALTGCGSSSKSSSGGGSGGALTASQLAAKADAACVSYVKHESQIPVPKDFVRNPVSAAHYLDTLMPFVRDEETAFEALNPPSSEKAAYQTLLADGKHQVGLVQAADAAAHAKNPAGLQDIAAAQRYKTSKLSPIEKKLGFTKCA
jgi:hypothetical protein